MKAIVIYRALQFVKRYIINYIDRYVDRYIARYNYNDVDIAPGYNREFRRLHMAIQFMVHGLPAWIEPWCEELMLKLPFSFGIRSDNERNMCRKVLMRDYEWEMRRTQYIVLLRCGVCPYMPLTIAVAWQKDIHIVYKPDGSTRRWHTQAIYRARWFFLPGMQRLLR